MALLSRLVGAYVVLALGLIVAVRDDFASLIGSIFADALTALSFLCAGLLVAIPITSLAARRRNTDASMQRLRRTLIAMALCVAFFSTFTVVKTILPSVVPFYADPALVAVDRFLHFGADPWRITHALFGWIDLGWLKSAYFLPWFVPAMFLPVILAAIDDDDARINRFVALYFLAWAGIGTVLAYLGSSAGPIFYDRLGHGSTFAELDRQIDSAPGLAAIREFLWAAYAGKTQSVGSGISAFPSVHVAMATVLALYLYERASRLRWVAVAIVVLYQVLSVHLGWHYAIDGYVSIALVSGCWAWLCSRARRSIRDGTAVAVTGQAARVDAEAGPCARPTVPGRVPGRGGWSHSTLLAPRRD